MARTRKEFTPYELSVEAFEVYSNSSFIFTEDAEGYYIDGTLIGGLEDLDEYLSELYDEDEEAEQ